MYFIWHCHIIIYPPLIAFFLNSLLNKRHKRIYLPHAYSKIHSDFTTRTLQSLIYTNYKSLSNSNHSKQICNNNKTNAIITFQESCIKHSNYNRDPKRIHKISFIYAYCHLNLISRSKNERTLVSMQDKVQVSSREGLFTAIKITTEEELG